VLNSTVPTNLLNHIRKTLSLLFILFLLAASRKSTDSGKYHLLEKRNPFYFLAYFFYFLATFFTFQLTFYINFTYTLLFFLLLHVLYQSTFFTNLASKKKSRGDYLFGFFAKK
jgi:hypothetical protein